MRVSIRLNEEQLARARLVDRTKDGSRSIPHDKDANIWTGPFCGWKKATPGFNKNQISNISDDFWTYSGDREPFAVDGHRAIFAYIYFGVPIEAEDLDRMSQAWWSITPHFYKTSDFSIDWYLTKRESIETKFLCNKYTATEFLLDFYRWRLATNQSQSALLPKYLREAGERLNLGNDTKPASGPVAVGSDVYNAMQCGRQWETQKERNIAIHLYRDAVDHSDRIKRLAKACA